MKTSKIFAILLSVAFTTGLFSCSDDSVKEPLSNPVVTPTGNTYQSLSFKWEPVAGAIQYGYRLSDENGAESTAGVTQDTEASFSGLQPATTYTLQVWAFAAIDGDYSTPPAVTLTASTDPLIKLVTPELTLDTSSENLVIKWDAVADAETYRYNIYDSNNERVGGGSTQKTSYTVKNLPTGDYQITVYATTSVGGYIDSEVASLSFSVERKELWRVDGTYYCIELDSSWPATMIAYDNSTYVIEKFYGVEGYNLEFAVDESNESDKFSFISGYYYEYSGWKYWILDTGVEYPDILYTYPWDNYSYFSGNSVAGEMGIGLYYGDDFDWGYDVFSWGDTGADFDIDTLPGEYDTWCYGEECNEYTDWEFAEFDYSDYSTYIEKASDTTVSIDGFYWDDAPIVGIVNTSEMTITFEPQTYGYEYGNGECYLFAASSDASKNVVATINDDGSIKIPDFGIWYEWEDGTFDNYVYGTVELIKITSDASKAKRKFAPTAKRITRSTKNVKQPSVKPLKK